VDSRDDAIQLETAGKTRILCPLLFFEYFFPFRCASSLTKSALINWALLRQRRNSAWQGDWSPCCRRLTNEINSRMVEAERNSYRLFPVVQTPLFLISAEKENTLWIITLSQGRYLFVQSFLCASLVIATLQRNWSPLLRYTIVTTSQL
jgi:hypothetical protein